MKKYQKLALGLLLLAAITVGGRAFYAERQAAQASHETSFAMSTVVTQTVYGPAGKQAAGEVSRALQEFERKLSLYDEDSEIAAVNAASGSPVQVSEGTFSLLEKSLALSKETGGAFQMTIAPVTLLWGVTGEAPHVPAQEEINAVLPLVDDAAVVLDKAACTVQLAPGQAIDLGGVAKGDACSLAEGIYEEYGVESAVLNIGGNVYVKGRSPKGELFRVGFRDPAAGADSYIAAIGMEDEVLAVSGGYERYFEENGVRYCHIMDSATGWPVESDIASVGVITDDGALSDFMSTTLYIWGSEKTRDYMAARPDLKIILLDETGSLYVSAALQERFELTEEAAAVYDLTFVG